MGILVNKRVQVKHREDDYENSSTVGEKFLHNLPNKAREAKLFFFSFSLFRESLHRVVDNLSPTPIALWSLALFSTKSKTPTTHFPFSAT